MTEQVRDNRELERYELAVTSDVAFAAYQRAGNVVIFTHTIVPEAAQGHGVASRLIEGALDDVRRRGETFVPECEFVVAYVEKHPEVRDLLAIAGA